MANGLRPFVLDRNRCHFLWYGGAAGDGLRSVGVSPPSKSVCSILPIAICGPGLPHLPGYGAPALRFAPPRCPKPSLPVIAGGRIIPSSMGIPLMEHLALSGWGEPFNLRTVTNRLSRKFVLIEFSEIRVRKESYFWLYKP